MSSPPKFRKVSAPTLDILKRLESVGKQTSSQESV